MSVVARFGSRVIVGSLLAASACGCSNMNNTQKGAALGAGGGAALGAIVGKQLGHTGAGAAIGALAGTAGGALAGNMKDEADRRDNYARQAVYERNRQARQQRALTNRDVVDMVANGVPDQQIIRAIGERGGNFDTSTSGLIYLNRSGVSDAVVQTMQTGNSY